MCVVLLQVLRSIWEPMSTHFHFAASMVTAIISVLFGGGTVLLNFIVSAVSHFVFGCANKGPTLLSRISLLVKDKSDCYIRV